MAYVMFISQLAGNKCFNTCTDAISVFVINVLFLVADFQPSRCVETYSRAVLHASDDSDVDLVSHSATITQIKTKLE